VFVSFIAHEIELGLGEKSVMRNVVWGLSLFYGEGFDYVREFVKKNLKGNVV